MPTARKRTLPKAAPQKRSLPMHRQFVAYVFAGVGIALLSSVVFAGGYAVGRDETLASSGSLLAVINARWQNLKARGVVPRGLAETTRLTGRVREITADGFILEADPVQFTLFSDEPFLRNVVFGRNAQIVDIGADGSGIGNPAPLKVGDIVAVSANTNIRTLGRIVAERVERFAR